MPKPAKYTPIGAGAPSINLVVPDKTFHNTFHNV